ncbi:T9SS type A sorting domain-containing protein, partial [bacterium]|nr:T9SS type A sorting domain-containing protein [bacterium]
NGDVDMDSCVFTNNMCTNANRAVIHSYRHELRIRQSSFLGNSPVAVSSLYNDNQMLIEADSNYWGHSSGPFHAELNSFGQGDTITGDSVDFSPWLDEDPLEAAEEPPIPEDYALFRAFPNPFNSSVTLEYAVAHEQDIKITIYDLLGREVESLSPGKLQAGVHQTIWTAESFASGIYLARLTSEDNRHTRMTTKLLLVK